MDEEEQHSHSAGQQSGGVPGQLLQAGPSPAAGFRRLPRFTSTVTAMTVRSIGVVTAMTVRSIGVVMKWINLAASAGSNSGGIKVRVTRMGG